MGKPQDASPEDRRIWVGSIVVDCTHLEAMIAFWQEALHYVPRDPPGPDGVILKDPAGRGPNLNLSRGDEAPLDDYRLHLDLYASEPLEEVDRLVRLGATIRRGPTPGSDFVTLADPDGNPFDVIDIHWPGMRTDWSFGRSE